MSNPVLLFIHFIATLARLLGPGGVRSIVAESLILTAPPVLSSDTLPNSICVARSMSAAVATAFSLVDDARESDSLTYYQDVFSFFRVLEVAGFNEVGRGEWI